MLNHLQDCAGDLEAMDRCYLPQDWLAEAGVDTASLRSPAASPGLRAVLNRMLGRDGRAQRSRRRPARPGA